MRISKACLPPASPGTWGQASAMTDPAAKARLAAGLTPAKSTLQRAPRRRAGAMSPEAYRATLEYARLTGEWTCAERATRARAWQHLFATIATLLGRERAARKPMAQRTGLAEGPM